MTDRLTEIEQRAAKATPGKWFVLDAFDAMKKGRWGVFYDFVTRTWNVADRDGRIFSRGHTHPLTALLAASEQAQENDNASH